MWRPSQSISRHLHDGRNRVAGFSRASSAVRPEPGSSSRETEEGKSGERETPSKEGIKDEVSEESQKAGRKQTPREPTRLERQEHEDQGCVVFRSWCKHCSAGKGIGATHQSSPEEEESAVPTISLDYGFMGEKENETMPILFMRDRKRKRPAASTEVAKGVAQYAVSFCVGWIRDLGWKRVIWKSDREPAILALKQAFTRAAGNVEVIPKDSPEGDHQANGLKWLCARESDR